MKLDNAIATAYSYTVQSPTVGTTWQIKNTDQVNSRQLKQFLPHNNRCADTSPEH